LLAIHALRSKLRDHEGRKEPFELLFQEIGMSDTVAETDWKGNYILYVTRPSGPQPEGEFGYGATFWLMNRSPGVPADTFAAFGNRGQYVVIVPSRNVVIVRRGEDPAGARFDIAKFSAEILAALKP
jgi:CubicO group peptidase (beta-lactamase class C family)